MTRLGFVRLSLSAVSCTYLLGGLDARFYATYAPLLYQPHPIIAWLPMLGETAFIALKLATVAALALAALHVGGRAIALVAATLFLILNGYVTSFSPAINWNVHLNVMLFFIAFAGPGGASDEQVLSALRLIVVFVYEQAFISKLLVSGVPWFLSGAELRVSSFLIGSPVAHWLAGFPALYPWAGMATFFVEAVLPLFLLRAKTRGSAAMLLIAFHLGTFALLEISFWHLWTLYPALFMTLGRKRQTTPAAPATPAPDRFP